MEIYHYIFQCISTYLCFGTSCLCLCWDGSPPAGQHSLRRDRQQHSGGGQRQAGSRTSVPLGNRRRYDPDNNLHSQARMKISTLCHADYQTVCVCVGQWRTRRTVTSWSWGTCWSGHTCRIWRTWPGKHTTRTTERSASRAWPAWWWRSATASTHSLARSITLRHASVTLYTDVRIDEPTTSLTDLPAHHRTPLNIYIRGLKVHKHEGSVRTLVLASRFSMVSVQQEEKFIYF